MTGQEFVDVDWSEALFREVNLTGARMRGVLLFNADIDGAINGLRINGVEVTPLIQAELDRLHPERTKLRPTTVDGMVPAWAVVESFWAATMRRAAALSPADLDRSVDGEWSFAQTLRHLVFVTDAWLGHAVLGERQPFHPLALPPSFIHHGADFGIDSAATPSYEEVVDARAGRMAMVREFLASATQEDLDRVREPNTAPGWPPPEARTATSCLHVLFNEEWAHHQFAIRDLTVIEAAT
ncbi:MAG TPA: DinB family protein [Micromonosporaceae bacterium]|nr:DinB family protein [Micromonosporaceae bacterium]